MELMKNFLRCSESLHKTITTLDDDLFGIRARDNQVKKSVHIRLIGKEKSLTKFQRPYSESLLSSKFPEEEN